MRTIFDILNVARTRPSMFYGLSLGPYEIFCHGYYAALSAHGVREPVPKVVTFHFGGWLNRRFGWSAACGWALAIQKQCKTDEEAYDKFFELLDEYRGLRPVKFAAITLSPDHEPPRNRASEIGVWPLPPARQEIYRYVPDEFYFTVWYYPNSVDDRTTSSSQELDLRHAETLWQIKPGEWDQAIDSEVCATPTDAIAVQPQLMIQRTDRARIRTDEQPREMTALKPAGRGSRARREIDSIKGPQERSS